MTDIIFFKNITCSDPAVCSETLVTKLESSLSLRLHADDENETGMNGAVNILHTNGNHKIRVQFEDETRGRVVKISTIPTKQQLEDASK